MSQPTPSPAIDPSQLCLQVRDDLVIVPQSYAGQPVYIVEDPLGGRYHRLGAREYAFVCCLNGATSITAAADRVAQQYPFTQDEALTLCRWLAANELLRPLRSAPTPERTRANRPWWLRNPLFLRIPLGTPDRLIRGLVGPFAWLHSPAAMVGGLGLLATALFTVLAQWDRFTASAHEIFSPASRVQLLLTWLILKLAHELGHGLVCKRYGGYVREAGIQLILFAPLPYVDVSSSWKFRSKWHRIHTALAGVYIEMAIAGVAAWVWNFTESGPLQQACAYVVVTVAVATLVFNANPLMRGDGYYVLSDMLEVPNLASLGRQYCLVQAKRLFFGVHPQGTSSASRPVKIYGVAALLWRVLVAAGLMLAAARMFAGAGLALVLVATVSSVVAVARRLHGYVRRPPPGESPTWRALAIRAGCSTAVAGALLLLAPEPFAPTAPGIIEYSPPTHVRAAAPGFVRAVHAVPGRQVRAGQLLFELENVELEAELKLAELEIAKAEIAARVHRQRQEMAACQAVEKELESLRKQRDEKQHAVDALRVLAPVDGSIVARGLDQLVGKYLAQGEELCLLGTPSAKEARVLVLQDDVAGFECRLGQEVTVRASGTAYSATLVRVAPRATTRLEYPGLASPSGGPLAVRLVAAQSSEATQPELLEPRFVAVARLESAESQQLLAGQLCQLELHGTRDRLWTAVSRSLRRWYRSQAGRQEP